VNTFILSESGGSQGLGFAIPSAVVASAYPDLRRYGRLRRGVVGIEVQANSADYADGLELTQSSGVLISDVLPGGPAAAAGVLVGDIVEAIGGHLTPTVAQFGLDMASRKPGDSLTLKLLRGSKRFSVTMDAIENARTDPRASARAEPAIHAVKRFGIIGLDVDEDLAVQLPKLRERSGVLVVAREAKSQETDNPLTSGDVIHCVNAYAVRSVDGLRAILDGFTPGSHVVVQIERAARLRFVVVQLPD
jgi:serine protease Do